MKRNLDSKYKGIKCTEENLIKYANQVFAVYWVSSQGCENMVHCEKVSVRHPYKSWFTAQDKYGNIVQHFLIDDPDVYIFVK